MGRTRRTRQRKRRNIPMNNEMMPVRATDSSTIELLQWMMGILQHTKLQLFHFPQSGRGFRSEADIHNGQILIRVPIDKMITRHLLSSKLNPAWSTHVMLVHFLCGEKRQNSNWKIYLNSLPQSYDVPLFDVDPDCISLIRPRSVQQLIQAQHDLVHDQFAKFGHNLDWPDFAWAWFTVNTRAVYFKDGHDNLALAPVLDMFNHDPHVSVHVETDSEFYTLKSGCDQPRGQVYISYGPHDNVKLYIEYGFVIHDSNNPHDHVKLCIEDLLICDFSDCQRKLEFIKNQGFDDKLQILNDEEVVTWSVLASFWILTSSDTSDLVSVFQADFSLENRTIRHCVKAVIERVSHEIQVTLEHPDVIRTCKVLPQLLQIQQAICRKSHEKLLKHYN